MKPANLYWLFSCAYLIGFFLTVFCGVQISRSSICLDLSCRWNHRSWLFNRTLLYEHRLGVSILGPTR